MNSFFINIAKNLQLKKDIKSKLNKLEGILKVFESHSSIDKSKKFPFRHIKDDEMQKFILDLDGSKATPDIHLPTITQ